MQGPSPLHWLGTDQLGRDTLSRVLFGGRIALTIAIIGIGVSLSLGLVLGISPATVRAGWTASCSW